MFVELHFVYFTQSKNQNFIQVTTLTATSYSMCSVACCDLSVTLSFLNGIFICVPPLLDGFSKATSTCIQLQCYPNNDLQAWLSVVDQMQTD